jgi:phenylpropionate dioxygenase-like ring-hydroxylating dioxygenase large terminal subunit
MYIGQNVLDRNLYAPVRRPLAEAEPLPSWCYTSEEFYRAEVERIYLKTWNFIGREEMVPTPGSYFTLRLVGVPLVIVRDRDGQVKAFLNSCRHRGTPLVEGSGKVARFSCPYHAWTYATDGRLTSAPGMQDVPNFRLPEYALVPVRLETWAGFLFVTMNENAPPLSAHLGNIASHLGSYKFEDMQVTRRKEYDLKCNWKAYVENAMEAYHTPTVHKSSIGLQICTVVDSVGEWVGLHEEHEGTEAILPEDTSPFPFIQGLEGLADKGTYFALIYPSTMLGCTRDCAWWLELQPGGPAATKVVVGSMFPKATVARPDFEEVVQRYYKRWDKSLPEDNWISELQHLGLSPYFKTSARLSTYEPIVHTFAQWVLDRVVD